MKSSLSRSCAVATTSWNQGSAVARPRGLSGFLCLYSQCAATPNSAVWCICCVRTWISSGLPCGPITVVCSDW